MSAYETVIGLEVHVQLKTRSKIFCACPTEFGAEPNSQICPICCGYPGVLPVLNRQVVIGIVRTALALNCRINPNSIFARKQYFYPDLPKNYQISQYELPVAENGFLEVREDDRTRGGEEMAGGRQPEGRATTKKVRIHRIHLEEDAGKLLHAVGSRVLDYSLVDLNRTGVPLMEIVSEPDIETPEQAAAYLSQLRTILRYIGVSECDMEKGSMRCDANVSLKPQGSKTLGTRAEVKNMNSFRAVREALVYEIERQTAALNAGERIVQETRLWDAVKGVTQSMRSKEEAHDYRYFPEPDLVPLDLTDDFVDEQRKGLAELPEVRRQRFVQDLALSEYDAGVLTAEKDLADYFENAVKALPDPGRREAAKPISNWITTELLGRLNSAKKGIEEAPVPPEHIAGLVKLVQAGTISGKTAKDVFDAMFKGEGDPESIVKKKGLVQIDDTKQIDGWIEEVIAANAKIVQDIRGGKDAAIGSLVGQVMKKSQGRANPQTVNRLLREKLSSN